MNDEPIWKQILYVIVGVPVILICSTIFYGLLFFLLELGTP